MQRPAFQAASHLPEGNHSEHQKPQPCPPNCQQHCQPCTDPQQPVTKRHRACSSLVPSERCRRGLRHHFHLPQQCSSDQHQRHCLRGQRQHQSAAASHQCRQQGEFTGLQTQELCCRYEQNIAWECTPCAVLSIVLMVPLNKYQTNHFYRIIHMSLYQSREFLGSDTFWTTAGPLWSAGKDGRAGAGCSSSPGVLQMP